MKEAVKRIKSDNPEYIKLAFSKGFVDLRIPNYTERVKLKQEVDEPFEITLDSKNFGNILSKLKDNITFKIPTKENVPILIYPGSYNTQVMKSINFFISRISNT